MEEIIEILLAKQKKDSKLKTQVEEELATLPKGTLSKREQFARKNRVTTGVNEYYSLSYYENGKHKSKYIGKDKATITALQNKVDRRQYLEKELKRLTSGLKAIEKMLKIAEKETNFPAIKGKLQEMRERQQVTSPPPPQPIQNIEPTDPPRT